MINKVLCIDDDQITLVLCEMVIKKAGFATEVVTAKNGREGLAWFSAYFSKNNNIPKQEAPQLILLDLNMPVMNGWDFLEDYLMKYSDRLPATKVVIISSTVNPEDFSRANRYEIVIDFINKPLTTEGLEELMEHEQLKAFF
ncbi:MAG: response regulator [Segetibacter sp.]|jgi:CheY-like chemotaxis protein|nr:response regulator [Segetibacter sp.]